jgi:NADH-quinone oxidoreductase subunit M
MKLLSLLLFLPLISALLLLFVSDKNQPFVKTISLIVNLVAFTGWAFVLWSIQNNWNIFPIEEKYNWFSVASGDINFTAGYHLTVDGLSLPMLLLTALVMLIATVSAFKIQTNVKAFFILFQILYTAILGTFLSADMLLFYVFFEFMLIPLYFMIGLWGGPKREYAAIKFFLFTLAGSLFILIAMIVLYASVNTFDLTALNGLNKLIPGSVLDPSEDFSFFGISASIWVLLLLITGFAIKVPVAPFHTWLPDAHVEAPTSVSIVLAALLLKTGTYGMIRFGGMILPGVFMHYHYVLAIFGVVSIIYGALNALGSNDLKRMIAYSSISHMGFVVLGIASGTQTAMQGAVFQMVSHGLISTMLFLIAGVLQDRTGDRIISHHSGLYQLMPKYSAIILIAFFAAMGIPGFSAFIGEFLILIGTYQDGNLPAVLPVIATLGILLSAAYLLWTIQRMLFGPFHTASGIKPADLTMTELGMLIPAAVITVILGIFPGLLLDIIAPFAEAWANIMSGKISMIEPR